MKLAQHPFIWTIGFKKTFGSRHAVNERRELLGLVGASLIFFVGMPGHSASLIQSTQHLVKNLVRLVMVFLGLAAPTPTATPQTATALAPMVKTMPMVAKPKPIPVKLHPSVPNSMNLRTVSNLRRYLYRFEGKASYQGAPSSNASVLVRIITGESTFTKGGITNEDGTYSIEIPVMAEDGAPVDWHMEAYTSEFQKLELSGRRIVQQEEESGELPIVVSSPVEFTASSDK